MKLVRPALAALAALLTMPHVLLAGSVSLRARDSGVSALWVLANISFAGMRAQDHPSRGWRLLAFLCGFPGTLLTFLVVPEGEERAYGIELPTPRPVPPFGE